MPACALVLGLPVLTSPARADDVVLHGATLPAGPTRLTHVSCTDFFADSSADATLLLHRGPGQAPSGARSLGLRPAGVGTATGAVHTTLDLGAARLSMSVGGPAAGVAYVWYAAADAPAGRAWRGSATLPRPAGWTRLDLADVPLRWELVDLGSRTVTDHADPATYPAFVSVHGPGPGLLMAGFGCDGAAFHLDAVSAGTGVATRTFDFEGLALSTSVETRTGPADGATLVRGVTRDADGVAVGEPLVLEAAPAGSEAFAPVGEPVSADADGVVQVEVAPKQDTAYRWRLPDVEYAPGHVSASVVVRGR